MKRSLRMLLALAAIMTMASLAQLSKPVSAHTLPGCSPPGVDDRGGGVEGCDHTHEPGDDGGDPDPGPGPTEEELWNTYCADLAGYATGHTVTFRSATPLTPEDLDFEGLPPDSDYVYQSIGCDCGPGCGAVLLIVVPAGAIPAVDPIVLRDRARARINPPDPTIGSSPPFDEAGRFGVVHIPTWFWIEDPWVALPPEEESEGSVTVRVEAYPLTVVFVPGDGGTVPPCDDGGVPWQPGLPDSATECRHTYTSSSAGQSGDLYALSAAVTWEFEWWINDVSQGTFGVFVATTDFTYQVGEIQAVES